MCLWCSAKNSQTPNIGFANQLLLEDNKLRSGGTGQLGPYRLPKALLSFVDALLLVPFGLTGHEVLVLMQSCRGVLLVVLSQNYDICSIGKFSTCRFPCVFKRATYVNSIFEKIMKIKVQQKWFTPETQHQSLVFKAGRHDNSLTTIVNNWEGKKQQIKQVRTPKGGRAHEKKKHNKSHSRLREVAAVHTWPSLHLVFAASKKKQHIFLT